MPPPPPKRPFSGDKVAGLGRPSSTPSDPDMSPPELIDDLIPEILVRVPPDDPASLVRASLVCKPWRRLLTDPGFLRRYRALHRSTPMLGFICNVSYPGARFVSTSSFRPAAPDRPGWHLITAGHGRALFQTIPDKRFVVWDPVTDQQWWLPPPVPVYLDCFNAALFCASASGGRDHFDCHGRPFRISFVCMDEFVGYTLARLYSSEAGEWSEQIKADENVSIDRQPSVLLGNTAYFTSNPVVVPGILEYEMAKGELSAIDPPLLHRGQVGTMLITTEAGMLGFAGIHESRLYLWSREVDPHGVVAWAQHRIIELETLLLTRPEIRRDVVGFAEGVGIIFVRLNSGVFSIELKSGSIQKVSYRERIYELYPSQTKRLFPYMSFCTPDRCHMKVVTATK